MSVVGGAAAKRLQSVENLNQRWSSPRKGKTCQEVGGRLETSGSEAEEKERFGTQRGGRKGKSFTRRILL